MTRIAVEIHEQDGLEAVPGLYVVELPDDGEERWAELSRMGGLERALWACLAPSGEVSIWNADLREGGYLGANPLRVDVTVQRFGNPASFEGVELYDGGGFVALEGRCAVQEGWKARVLERGPENASQVLGEQTGVALFPNAPTDYTEVSGGGSARMAGHVRAAVRVSALQGYWPAFWRTQTNANLCRPGVGLFEPGDGGAPLPFLGFRHPHSTCATNYGWRTAWGSRLHGAHEHFGRPAGELVSPWEPDDYYHFAAQQHVHSAACGSVAAAVHLRGMFEAQWRHLQHSKITNARGYRMIGDMADAVEVFEAMGGQWRAYAEHLLDVVIPALVDTLDEKSREAAAEIGGPFELNVAEGGNSDHPEGTQCPWMTGQLFMGLYRARAMLLGRPGRENLLQRVERQMVRAADFLVTHSWLLGAGEERGWPEDYGPQGEHRASSKSAMTGKYRQWILPALEEILAWALERAEAAELPKERRSFETLAKRALQRANWLAGQQVQTNWYGSGSAPDKGWGRALCDEFWLTSGRLGATTREGWLEALGAS